MTLEVKALGGQPAFPVPNDAHNNGECGLTKREEFAKAAMSSIILAQAIGGADERHSTIEIDYEPTAKAAIGFADALLEQLAKETP